MGNYSTLFDLTDEQSDANLNPKSGDFAILCADLTGMAIVEVQRFWFRFKQLGCDKKANLSKKVMEKGELAQDPFIKNIVSNLPKEKDGSLSFLVFLKFFYWLDTSDEEIKLRVIFNYFNNGNDLDEEILYKLMKRLYPPGSVNESKLRKTVELLMKQLDNIGAGRVDEEMFVNNVRRHYSINELRSYLKIEIIPSDILEDVNYQPSMAGSQSSLRNNNGGVRSDSPNGSNKSELTDALLDQVTSKAVKQKWEKLVVDLGYLESDIKAYRTKHEQNQFEALLDMLMDWRDQDPHIATKARLRRYLDSAKMTEASKVLQ